MTKILFAVAIVALVVLLFLVWQAHQSRAGDPPGLFDGQLRPCPGTPNCVCSEYPDENAHYVAPLELDGMAANEAMQRLKHVIADLGGQVEIDYGDYVAAVFTSDLFGFADDLELRVDQRANRVHIRSASRVGRGDFDVNRERVERIKRLFHERN